jgi:hypothetical protein
VRSTLACEHVYRLGLSQRWLQRRVRGLHLTRVQPLRRLLEEANERKRQEADARIVASKQAMEQAEAELARAFHEKELKSEEKRLQFEKLRLQNQEALKAKAEKQAAKMKRVVAELTRREEEKLKVYAQRDFEVQERLHRIAEERAKEEERKKAEEEVKAAELV